MDKLHEIKSALNMATPGPWNLGAGCIYTKPDGKVNPICVTPNNEHNAHLIAKAPEWLKYQGLIIDAQDHTIRMQEREIDRLKQIVTGFEKEFYLLRKEIPSGV